jgi:hypothetical protein
MHQIMDLGEGYVLTRAADGTPCVTAHDPENIAQGRPDSICVFPDKAEADLWQSLLPASGLTLECRAERVRDWPALLRRALADGLTYVLVLVPSRAGGNNLPMGVQNIKDVLSFWETFGQT